MLGKAQQLRRHHDIQPGRQMRAAQVAITACVRSPVMVPFDFIRDYAIHK